MKECPACGYENPADAEFCDACGYELGAASVGAPAPDPAPAPPPLPSPPPEPVSFPDPDPTPAPEPFYPTPAPEPFYPDPTPAPEPFYPTPAPEPSYPSPAPAPPPIPAGTTARLISKQAGSPIPEFTIEGSGIIGRFDPDMGPVEVDLEEFPGQDTVSRSHAEIYYEGGQWKIKDLGSTNHVFIKRSGQPRFGAMITAPEPLYPGDEIAIGKIRFQFQSP